MFASVGLKQGEWLKIGLCVTFWTCRRRAKLLCFMPAVNRFYPISQAKQSASDACNLQVICAEAGKIVFTRHHAFWITPRLLSLILENCTFMRGNPHLLWKCLKYVICISCSRTVNLLTRFLHFEKDEHGLWKEILALGRINRSSSSTPVVNPFLCLFILTGNGNVHMWIKKETINALVFFSLSLPQFFHWCQKKSFLAEMLRLLMSCLDICLGAPRF